ncbi:DUF2613 family protein [Corynebacterium poyangense]|uniref:DUF2613 family protein n=1 Tax=Corynebacterium poyangense TaxID=2684405 RepID=A0A7H0SLG7_9CORY|nr:DUF2613 domain-containing protein [Corynebacterium poyangense]MBZ8177489.1 DUF2613 family protein [Corynebacterium poyangense]QNQ89392.1 DUF2613 family protein [Corynebacterium poyangense]
MAFDSDSLPRRTIGPALASAVVGIAFGVVTVLGLAMFSGEDQAPASHSTHAEDALLGGPEYGSRQ